MAIAGKTRGETTPCIQTRRLTCMWARSTTRQQDNHYANRRVQAPWRLREALAGAPARAALAEPLAGHARDDLSGEASGDCHAMLRRYTKTEVARSGEPAGVSAGVPAGMCPIQVLVEVARPPLHPDKSEEDDGDDSHSAPVLPMRDLL
ncbi:uncharacterized protein SPSK_08052 [Sporothrix schenckii 1099-18]|uniref:Uncharacterized protein n=1 Tax=Sporothrix schenckii 1099-18 TaxID=1397361 RepID=A0A0F2MDJ2_SPOSC|nr:uncharacterized protein SPSK_08052 [Sporothrix schenckii 1099-18]KJR87753.1 hypothetical protein SPSK_08052 [Sporothrix schenckii 1099-18]